MSYDRTDWERVASAVVARREDLEMTQAEVSQEAGISLDRVSAIERARTTSYRSGTLRAIERALRWKTRSINAILDGGEPTPLMVVGEGSLDEAARGGEPTEEEVRAAHEAVRRMAEGPPEDEFEYMMRMYEEDIKDRKRREALRAMMESWRDSG